MLLITDGVSLERALTYPLDPRIKRLLRLRRDQLGTIENNARFIVVEAGDTPRCLEETLGFSVFRPCSGRPRTRSPQGIKFIAQKRHGRFINLSH